MEINKGIKANHVHHHGSMQPEGNGKDMMHHGHMMMDMHSHAGGFSMVTNSDFLIEGINIASVEGIILAMIFTMVITVLNDILKVVLHQWEPRASDQSANKRSENTVLIVKVIIHMTSVFLACLTMLSVMTMNAWLIISVVLSSGISHLLIRPFLFEKLRRCSGQTKTDIVKEDVKLLYDGNKSPTEENHCCNIDSITTSTRLISNTNNI